MSADSNDAALAELPQRSGYRRRTARAAGRAIDALLTARQAAAGTSRELDAAASEAKPGRVLILAVYGSDGAAPMAAALAELRESRHLLTFALGSMGPAAPALREETVMTDLRGGKFANLNRLAEACAPLAADHVLVLDDDITLSRRFLDRLVAAATGLGLELAQPALSRASHGAWRINRRRADLARRTNFVEIGPALLISRKAWHELAPFPEEGMGWGLCLHWGAVARRLGWKVGVIDAVPVRNESRPPAGGYDRTEAKAAAARLLASSEHITRAEAERTIDVHAGLP